MHKKALFLIVLTLYNFANIDMPKFPDEIQPFSIYQTNIRGRIVRLGNAYSEVLKLENYPVQVASLLGELTTVAIALADSMKYDGQFILQTQSDGPVGTMVSHVKYNGTFRSYANYNKNEFDFDTVENSMIGLLGKGQIAFTVDQGKNTKRYQGITNLEGKNIAKCVESYFKKSEQISTSILLAAKPEEKKASAFMLQKIAGEDSSSDLIKDEYREESWHNANVLMESVRFEELLDHNVSSNALLYRLFHESGVQIYETKTIKYQCHCSKENIANSLATFSTEELNKMENVKGLISATCEFCKKPYTFSRQNLEEVSKSVT